MRRILSLFSALCALYYANSNAESYTPKIYDCFLFYNELEVLEIKLNELYDHVDKFVLVESVESFRGKEKRLVFSENKDRFSQFLDKIIHVVVSDHFEHNNPWYREEYQRNQIMRGLIDCNDDDIIIIEDLDEIIRATKIPEIIEPIVKNELQYVSCSQSLYYYYLNCFGRPWCGSVVSKYSFLKEYTPNEIRSLRGDEYMKLNNGIRCMPDAGWHFSYMGGIDRVMDKIANCSHHELDNKTYNCPTRIDDDIKALEFQKIDDTFPQFVRDHIHCFIALGFLRESDL